MKRTVFSLLLALMAVTAIGQTLTQRKTIKSINFGVLKLEQITQASDTAYAMLIKTTNRYQKHITVALGDRAIRRNLRAGEIVRLGGMTDCFQPYEHLRKATYHTIEELNRRNIGYLIVTKSGIVAEDRYLSVMRKDLAHIQITVTCTDDAFCRLYEKATPPSQRIKAIERLQADGFDVSLRLSPFIPQFVEQRVLDMDIINDVKCDKILVEFLRVNTWIRKWFDIDYSEYTLKQSGYEHLPLEKKIEYLRLIQGDKQLTVCEDVDEHYLYWQQNVNRNPHDCCNLTKYNK